MQKFGPPAHFLPQLGSEHVYPTISLGFKGFVVWFVVVCTGLWWFVVWFVVVCGVLWCFVVFSATLLNCLIRFSQNIQQECSF